MAQYWPHPFLLVYGARRRLGPQKMNLADSPYSIFTLTGVEFIYFYVAKNEGEGLTYKKEVLDNVRIC